MEKEFSFIEMVKYCFRKWLIIALCAVIGFGGYMTYTILTMESSDAMAAEATLSIASIDAFYPDPVLPEALEGISKAYEAKVRRALDVMTNESLKSDAYANVRAKLEAHYKEYTPTKVQQIYLDSLTVNKSSFYVTVRYKYLGTMASDTTLAKDLVASFISDAQAAVLTDSPTFEGDKLKLSDVSVRVVAPSTVERGRSIVISIIIGGLLGGLLGFLITVIIFFADKRIKSYGDIAVETGNRLLGAGDLRPVSPQLDAIMTQKSFHSVLLAQVGNVEESLCREVTDYFGASGRKTLSIRFGKESDGKLLSYLKGGLIESADLLSMKASLSDLTYILPNIERFNALSKQFDRIVLVADFIGSGALTCLASVSDCFVLVTHQPKTTVRDVLAAVYEISAPEKAVGAVICSPGASYVS